MADVYAEREQEMLLEEEISAARLQVQRSRAEFWSVPSGLVWFLSDSHFGYFCGGVRNGSVMRYLLNLVLSCFILIFFPKEFAYVCRAAEWKST